MCGIVGYLAVKDIIAPSSFEEMTDLLAFRGPDSRSTKYFYDGRIALGHRRLSIVDLSSAGSQPMSNRRRDIWLTFNGEIYNHPDLKRELSRLGYEYRSSCDAETILHAYEEWGDECVNRFRGVFSFAIWDDRRKRLFCARDHIGVKPFYYSDCNNYFVFASQPRSILAMEGFKRRIDPQGFVDYLSYGIVPDEHSAYMGIRKLRPGHTLVWSDGEVKIARYWQLHYTPEITNLTEARSCVEEAIVESVGLQLMSDVPVATYLSGGIDSSLITSIATKIYGQPMDSFTVGFEEKGSDERAYASIMAAHSGTHHHEIVLRREDMLNMVDEVIEAFDEPYGLGAAFPMMMIARLTNQQGVKVVLSGDGADELFAGYRHYDEFGELYRRYGIKTFSEVTNRWRNIFSQIRYGKLDPPKQYFNRECVMDQKIQRKLLSTDILTTSDEDTKWRFRRYFDERLPAVMAGQIIDINTYLPDEILVKVDRSTMAYGVEARVPFLDQKLVELAFSIDTNLMYENGERKSLLKSVAKNWLPSKLLTRRKKGFSIPLAQWLAQGNLLEYISSELCDGFLVQTNILNGDGIKATLERIKPNDVWQLYIAELWARRWLSQA